MNAQQEGCHVEFGGGFKLPPTAVTVAVVSFVVVGGEKDDWRETDVGVAALLAFMVMTTKLLLSRSCGSRKKIDFCRKAYV